MKWKSFLLVIIAAVVLTACNNNGQTKTTSSGSVNDGQASKNENNAIGHDLEDGAVGFEMAGGNIEEATNVPEGEKQALLAAFKEYIDSLNAEDINRYKAILSKNPKGFNVDEDVARLTTIFESSNNKFVPSDETIIKYSDNEAQVFSNLSVSTSLPDASMKRDTTGRQVTVFVKEDGQWKVSIIYAVGNPSSEQ